MYSRLLLPTIYLSFHAAVCVVTTAQVSNVSWQRCISVHNLLYLCLYTGNWIKFRQLYCKKKKNSSFHKNKTKIRVWCPISVTLSNCFFLPRNVNFGANFNKVNCICSTVVFILQLSRYKY